MDFSPGFNVKLIFYTSLELHASLVMLAQQVNFNNFWASTDDNTPRKMRYIFLRASIMIPVDVKSAAFEVAVHTQSQFGGLYHANFV